jgi:hypothetical protein
MADNPNVLLRITAHSTPHYADPADAYQFYAALGMLSVAWGRLEGHVIGNLLTIMSLLGAPKTPSLFRWSQRLKLWRKGFSSLPGLQAHNDRAVAFMESIVAAAKFRNFAAHAIWQEFEPNAVEPTMTARSIRDKRRSPDTIEVDDRRIPLSMVNAALAECNQLNFRMVEFTNLIHSLRPCLVEAQRL